QTEPAQTRSSADFLRSAARSRAVRPALAYIRSLRPAWWIVRGYMLVAGVLAAISQGGGYHLHTIGSYTQGYADQASSHASLLWLLVPVGAIVASITVGVLADRLPAPLKLAVIAVNLVTVALVIAYPTWWLAPAFASYSGLVNW